MIELLRVANPESHGISRIIVWGSASTLALIEDRPWLEKMTHSFQERGLLARSIWQRYYLSKATHATNCDILY